MNNVLNFTEIDNKPAFLVECDSCGQTSVVSRDHKRYCPVCGPDSITPITIKSLDGLKQSSTGNTEVNWEEVGPRAVFSLIETLYEQKIYQGKNEFEADREADEEVCEKLGITLAQLGDLYDTAGFDNAAAITKGE